MSAEPVASAQPSADSPHTLYLVDGSGFIFRAFYGIRTPMSATDGTPTNAVYGFVRLLQNLLRDRQPTHIAVLFDPSGPTFRNGIFDAYKANRAEAPDELKPQFALCREAVAALNIPALRVDGYEADDLIGTLARRWNDADPHHHTLIVTADKDLMQLVDDRTTLWDGKEKDTDAAGVVERFGVAPERVIDVLGLAGDTSDNIPGVPGIGEKTAAKLLAEYGTMDALLAAADGIKGKRGENLREFADQARLSRTLATIKLDVPVEVDFGALVRSKFDPDVLSPFLRRLNFKSFLKEFGVEDHRPTRSASGIERAGYRTLTTMAGLDDALKAVRKTGRLSFDLETTSLSTHDAEIVGFALCWAPGEAAYVPVGHTGPDATGQLDRQAVLDKLAPVLGDWTIQKFGQNLKYEWQVLGKYGVKLEGVAGDSMLAAYLLDPNRPRYNLDELALDVLHHTMISFSEVTGQKKPGDGAFAAVSLTAATEYAAEDADVALRLCDHFLPELAKSPGLAELNRDLEIPLSRMLARMEYTGIKVDADLLRGQSTHFGALIDTLESEIHELAGGKFTIDSPKQLGEVLFEKLGLPRGQKTDKGASSTNAQVLQGLAHQHPLPEKVLHYRHLTKLRSTYLDTLPGLIHPVTGRVHSSFRQAVAATGRISSSDPNLQNIPVRTAEGRDIRRAFITDPGWKLLSADYSQVELRLLAHFSEAPGLVEAFQAGTDIHARTASDLFGVAIEAVTGEQRRRAKAINFGLMYGMSAFRLATELGVSRSEAQEVHDRYFRTYGGVKRYLDEAIRNAEETGHATTLLGRVRPLPDIHSKQFNVREQARRLAINTPIQGTAADILKRAMIVLDERLQAERLASRILLTVHDELVLEAPEAEVARVTDLVRDTMEGAATLRVPLKVDVGIGDNWAEIH